MPDLECPNCGAEIPDTGISGAMGHGDPAGNIHWQPSRQHTTCKSCGTKLVRNPDSEVPDLQRWRPNELAADE